MSKSLILTFSQQALRLVQSMGLLKIFCPRLVSYRNRTLETGYRYLRITNLQERKPPKINILSCKTFSPLSYFVHHFSSHFIHHCLITCFHSIVELINIVTIATIKVWIHLFIIIHLLQPINVASSSSSS